jgi:hypothetical protein
LRVVWETKMRTILETNVCPFFRLRWQQYFLDHGEYSFLDQGDNRFFRLMWEQFLRPWSYFSSPACPRR